MLFGFLVVGNPLRLAHDKRKGAEDEDTGGASWTPRTGAQLDLRKMGTGHGKPLAMKG